MKKKLIFFSLLFFMIYILCFPKDAVASAAYGITLWYEKVLPSLLPFAILSNILIYSNYLTYIVRFLAPPLQILLPISENGAFVLLSGFLFGFPMGSRNCAELLKCGQLEKKEADILFIITNNISPVFVISYILYQQLGMPELALLSIGILYLPPLLMGLLLFQSSRETDFVHKKPTSGSQINFKIIDAGIMNGFETLAKLGGYIMLFSMLASMLQKLPIPQLMKVILTGITEITNGISILPRTAMPSSICYILAMTFTAFGGLSGLAQTSSMIRDTNLSMKTYILGKLLLTGITSLLAWLVTLWLL